MNINNINIMLYSKSLFSGEVLFDKTRQLIPMGDLGRVYEDCVPPIIFMLSPGVCYTTGQWFFGAGKVFNLVAHSGDFIGQTLDVCGGLSLYNNYMNQYQNMGTWYQKLADEKEWPFLIPTKHD